MRGLHRNRTQADEEESVFVTMTDMTISFLLILMVLLAFFATQLNSDDTVPQTEYERLQAELADAHAKISKLEAELLRRTTERDIARDELNEARQQNAALRARVLELEAEIARLRAELLKVTKERDALLEKLAQMSQTNPLEAYLSQAIIQRREILEKLRKRLKIEFPDLQVVISPEQDALRFQGEGLFRSGSSWLEPRQRRIVETMGRLLDDILVCFTLGDRASRKPDCESGHALIEAVQIEGHTDSDGTDPTNLRLATDRANATLLVMLNQNRKILDHENIRSQPVMSVSGYGEMRPIATNETIKGKADNRRIDLRIIMYAPSTVDDVKEVGRRLDALRAAGAAE